MPVARGHLTLRAFRLDETAMELIRALSEKLGVSQSAVIRIALRRLGELEKIPGGFVRASVGQGSR